MKAKTKIKVSVVMATLNSGRVIRECLASIRSQNYDQKSIEIICADGGSKDGTQELIKSFGGIVVREHTGSPEAAKAVALKKAVGEIILEIDDDNILPNPNWLGGMLDLFEKEKKITGCYTYRYSYRRVDKPLNRYFALFGANDPVAYFLGRNDRQDYIHDKWTLAGKAIDKGDYFLVEYDNKNIPTLGANGFLIKRKLLEKAKINRGYFFHIDVNWDLINMGFNKYAVAKNEIIHASGESFFHFFLKRKRYMEELYLRDLQKRRYLLYDKTRDRNRVILFSLYALSIVFPLYDSIKGNRKLKDWAWFMHPVVCLAIFWIYFTAVTSWQLRHHIRSLLGR